MNYNINFDDLENEIFEEITKNLTNNNNHSIFAKRIIKKSLKATKLMIIKYHQELFKEELSQIENPKKL